MAFQPEKPNFDKEEAPEEKRPEEMTMDELFEQDLGDVDILGEIVRRGDEEDLRRLKERKGFSEKEIELAKYHVDLRDEVVEEVNEEIEKRKEERPESTKEEMELGAYREAIESQVRDAVFKLREKGYNTVASGFGEPAAQQIDFEENGYLDEFDQEELKEDMEQKNVEMEFSPRTVGFICRGKLSLEEIKEVWDTVAEKLPEIEKGAEKSKSNAAERFREEQKKLEND